MRICSYNRVMLPEIPNHGYAHSIIFKYVKYNAWHLLYSDSPLVGVDLDGKLVIGAVNENTAVYTRDYFPTVGNWGAEETISSFVMTDSEVIIPIWTDSNICDVNENVLLGKTEPKLVHCDTSFRLGMLMGLNGAPMPVIKSDQDLKSVSWIEGDLDLGSSTPVIYQCGGRLVAHSYEDDYSRIWVSTNGKTWEEKPNIPVSCIYFKYCDGIYLAHSNADEVYVSTDLETWTKVNIPTLTDGKDNIRSLVYANGMFVITPYNVSLYPYYSTDGINWTQCTLPKKTTSQLYAQYVGDMWFLRSTGTGTNYYSYDGKTWTLSSIPYGPSVYRYANGVYIATPSYPQTPNCEYFYSTNGINWTKKNIIGNNESFRILYDYGYWFAYTNTNGVYRSSDGLNWEKILDNGIGSSSPKLVYGNDTWVIMLVDSSYNDIGIWYSKDCANWHQSNITDTNPDATYTSVSVVYADGVFIAGQYYSVDGAVWKEAPIDRNIVSTSPVYYRGVWVKNAYNRYENTDESSWDDWVYSDSRFYYSETP